MEMTSRTDLTARLVEMLENARLSICVSCSHGLPIVNTHETKTGFHLCSAHTLLPIIALLREAEAAQASGGDGWRTMDSAPKDGSKIDLLYPYPRGRQIDCFWISDRPLGPGWYSKWSHSTIPNMQPTHWRYPPPSPEREGE